MRKPWTQNEDSCLKKLREELNMNKWSDISKQMVEQFGIVGRSQKQCRQRYHNHLDSGVKNRKLTQEREIAFFEIHDEIGNKWSSIASRFPGVSDNYLKNIMHSKLRGAIRKLNRQTKDMRDNLNDDFKLYPLEIVYRVIEQCERSRDTQHSDEAYRVFCLGIKNKLLEYNGGKTVHRHFNEHSEMEMSRELMSDLNSFEDTLSPETKGKTYSKCATTTEPKAMKPQATNCNDGDKDDASLFLLDGQQSEKREPETFKAERKSSLKTSDSCETDGLLTGYSDAKTSNGKQGGLKRGESSNDFLDNLCMEEESYVERCFSLEEAEQPFDLLPMPFFRDFESPLEFPSSEDSFSLGLDREWFQ